MVHSVVAVKESVPRGVEPTTLPIGIGKLYQSLNKIPEGWFYGNNEQTMEHVFGRENGRPDGTKEIFANDISTIRVVPLGLKKIP